MGFNKVFEAINSSNSSFGSKELTRVRMHEIADLVSFDSFQNFTTFLIICRMEINYT